MTRLFALSLLLAVPSSAAPQATDCAATTTTPDWRTNVTDGDRVRLRDWRTAFTHALEQAQAAGNAADVAGEGVLLQPDAALGGPIPAGDYRCRTIKVGAKAEGMLNYVAYPPFQCRVSPEGDAQHLDKLNGSQRPHGTIYPGDQLRQVFLGTIVLGDERVAYKYGRDPERDMAGWVERIGEARWRLVLPYPHYESTLDVIELVPEQ